MKLNPLAFGLPLVLAACADGGANYEPILDGPKTAAFQADLADCQHLAKSQKQFDQETLGATALGAGLGAVLGHSDDDGTAAGGAIAGAVAGGLGGAANAGERREDIVRECLKARNHPVVG